MKNSDQVNRELNQVEQAIPGQLPQVALKAPKAVTLKKIRGGFFLVVGFLLSPMSWWNDLFFNLPVAYFFGYVCSWFSPDLLIPCTLAGYWFSNIGGILLMQVGVIDVFQEQSQERNLKRELLIGVVSSTAYTFLILALVQLGIIGTPALFFS